MDGPKIPPEHKADHPPMKKPGRNKYSFACALLASMTSVLLGYDTAVMSGAAMFIKDDLHVSDTQLEVLAGIINLYSLIGSLAAGYTSDWIGRRYTMVLAAAIFFAGALLMGLAINYALLMFGRFIAGIGVGYALMIAPVFTAEIAPASARGFLTSFPEVFINFGVLLGYIANFGFAGLPNHLNWRIMFLVGAIPPIFLAAGVLLLMPESPRWLVMQGRHDAAARVLTRISDSPEEAELRLEEIKAAAAEGGNSRHGKGVWKELLHPTPSVRRVLIAAIGLQFFQQASGIDSVVLYSPRIFEKAGITSKSQKLGATVAVGFTKTSFILIATFFLDRVGRRPLLLSSAGGMVASLLALASALLVVERKGTNGRKVPKAAVGMSIATVLTFVASFSMGLGPIAWVYSSEIFPIRLRAQGASLGTATNRVMSGVVSMTFISLYKAITISGSFFLYAGIATVGLLFFYACLPETKGRSLEEMAEVFDSGDRKETGLKKDEVTGGGHLAGGEGGGQDCQVKSV